MAHIALGNGKWFDDNKATKFEEAQRWNGNNNISCATGSQFEHEALYLTSTGRWILHEWSQWQGSTETYRVISENDAHQWLISQGHRDAVPTEVLAAGEV